MNIKNAAVYGASVRTRAAARHQSVITHHTSTCRTDTFTLTEPLSFTWRGREMESKGRDIKKLPRFFFLFSSFHCCLSNLSIPPTPNHQLSGLACHCWVSLFSFRGAPDFFFLFFSPLWGNLPFHQSMQESPVGLLHCMGGVRGRSAPRIHQKGEALALLCPAVRTPSSHSRPVFIFGPLPQDRETLEVSSLFARTLGSPQGARYLLQEPLSSGQWLMKPAWWQVLMSSPRLFFFGGPLLHC